MPIARELRHLYRTPEFLAARARARARAGGHCEWCRKPEGHGVWVVRDGTGRWSFSGILWYSDRGLPSPRPRESAVRIRVKLGTAHLDQNPANNADDNLAMLCQRCHLVYDAPAHRQTARLRRDRATGQLRLELARRPALDPLDKLIAEQREAYRAYAVGSPGARLWMADLVGEEVMLRGEAQANGEAEKTGVGGGADRGARANGA